MAIEMNEKEYEKFTKELLLDIEVNIRLIYNSNKKPSSKGAVLVMVDDNDIEQNSLNYISQDSKLYNFLTDRQKSRFEDVPEEEIFVMIAWNGMYSYFTLNKEEESTFDFSNEQIEDTEENEEKILTLFYYEYMDVKSDKIDMTDVGDEDSYNEACKHALKNTIESGNESPESLMTFVYFFTYKELKKIDYVDGKGVIKTENMLRNLNEVEKFNFSFIGGTILVEIFNILDSSSLKENEKIDYRLDINNFITVANGSAGLEFDKNTKTFDGLIGLANEMRNNK